MKKLPLTFLGLYCKIICFLIIVKRKVIRLGNILSNPTFIFGITFGVILLLSVIGTRKSLGTVTAENFFSINQTNWIKGFAIALVAFSHYYGNIGVTVTGAGYVGAFGVGVFFLCSGYGLTVSKLKKTDYAKGFLKNKLLRIYAPYTIAFIAEWLIVLLTPFSCDDNIIINYLTISLPKALIWYLKVQVTLYIVYYIMLLISKNNNKLFCGGIFAISIAYMIIGFCVGLKPHWYQNALWFPIGIFIAMNKTAVYNFISKYFIRAVIITLFMFALGWGLIHFISGDVLHQIIMIYGLIAFVVIISTKVCGSSKLMNFLGRHSIEIYFSHSMVSKCLGSYFIMDNLVWAFVFIIVSVLLAIPIKFLSNKIVKTVDTITVKK